jgi:hypothetical protein
MRRAILLFAALVSAQAEARDDPDARVLVLAPASTESFYSMLFNGRIARHDASGKVIESLGPVPLASHEHLVARIEVTRDGLLVATEEQLLRVRDSAIAPVVSPDMLGEVGCWRIEDFAFDATGERGAILAYASDNSSATVLLSFERGVLRRLASRLHIISSSHVAVDAKGRYVAFLVDSPSFQFGSESPAGPLAVYDLAGGRRLWELARCEGPQYGRSFLQFAGDRLVACAPKLRSGAPDALAAYDASGHVIWRRDLGFLYARSEVALLVEDRVAARLDLVTGRLQPLGVSWVAAPLGGVLLDGSRVATADSESRAPRVVEVATAPWASRR